MTMIEHSALDLIARDINSMCGYFHGKSTSNGWWTKDVCENPFTVPCKLMLAVSELSEAMEGHRKNLMDDKLPNRQAIEVELADCLIRIFDLSGFLGLDVGGAVAEKSKYNDIRADHKIESRNATNGKQY